MHLVGVLAMLLLAQSSDRVMLLETANARTRPAIDAPILCTRRFGTELQVQSREAGWLRVSGCGPDAYLSERLTRDVTPGNLLAVREDLVRDRLTRTADSFSNAEHLLFLAEAWGRDARVGRDREAAARYALYELQALAGAANAAESTGAFRGSFAFRLGDQSPVLFYNEVGGGWMIRNEHTWTVHDRFRDTAAADDIAWFAAEHGVGGECEGSVECLVKVLDMLAGEYLRRHPTGAHVGNALRKIEQWLDFGGQTPDVKDYGETPKGTTCRDLTPALAALTEAVGRVSSPRKARALAPLQQIAAACR